MNVDFTGTPAVLAMVAYAQTLGVTLEVSEDDHAFAIEWISNQGKRGAGAKAMAHVIATADALNKPLILDAHEGHPDLVSYYAKLGFTPWVAQPGVFGNEWEHGMRRRSQHPAAQPFDRWFGNSQVVDASGDPLVVYHGTSRDFASFDLARTNQGDPDFVVTGFHFSADPYMPGVYAGPKGQVMPVYLSIQNPATHGQVERAADAINGTWETAYPDARTLLDAVRLHLQEQGFDGFKPYAKGNQWVAFRPEQIKSAIGNSGLYAKDNPDITDRRVAAAQEALDYLSAMTTRAVPRA